MTRVNDLINCFILKPWRTALEIKINLATLAYTYHLNIFIMQRIFHPVGQGSFFSETFTETQTPYRIVFDCGSSTLTSKLRKVKINSSVRKGETIDILFISHFHADHINAIEYLIQGRKV
ncbi:MBL fold metallo-hydrolase [Mucilaginibacter gynuensis]|uniref:MBL fold metallo-hydrolase n=1 Tax=Mucilaginibacter gynuensis TaxID=1302236 RepID=UPI003CD0ACB2